MSILEKFSSLFSNKKNKEEKKEKSYDKVASDSIKEIKIFPIYVSPNIYLAHRGARICIGKGPLNDSFTARMKHVEKTITRGHESIEEHTNAIAIMQIPIDSFSKNPDLASQYIEFSTNLKYLNTVSNTKDGFINILIGGSARAWTHCVRETSADNVFAIRLVNLMCMMFEKAFMVPLIDLQLVDEEKCNYLYNAQLRTVKAAVTQVKSKLEKNTNDPDNMAVEADEVVEPEEYDKERCTLVFKTPINKITNLIKDYGFVEKDAMRVATISFIFHHISRSCANQLTRHRVGISQESQRYVTHDYKKAYHFIDPIEMNYEDRYKGDEKFEGVINKLKDINPFRTHAYLISNGIYKEDARAWLPMNVTTQLMMTFTYENFGKFLLLRMDKAAQKEIRLVAEEAASFIVDGDELGNFINVSTQYRSKYFDTIPVFKPDAEDDDIDDLISEKVEDIKPMIINSTDDAKELIERSEQYKKLEKEN